MYKFIFTSLLLCLSLFTNASVEDKSAFIIVCKTTESNQSFSIPIKQKFGTLYRCKIDWDDDEIYETETYNNSQYDFKNAGEHRIHIIAETLELDPSKWSSEQKNMIIDIAQWGTVKWQSMRSLFSSCSNLKSFSATDKPNLSECEDLGFMFYKASSFNSDISNWDTSNITSMNAMFEGASCFNQDLTEWDTSNVENMETMFSAAKAFNGDISDWDVSQLENMAGMFEHTDNFDGNLSNWNFSSIQNMTKFLYASKGFSSVNYKNLLYALSKSDVQNIDISVWSDLVDNDAIDIKNKLRENNNQIYDLSDETINIQIHLGETVNVFPLSTAQSLFEYYDADYNIICNTDSENFWVDTNNNNQIDASENLITIDTKLSIQELLLIKNKPNLLKQETIEISFDNVLKKAIKKTYIFNCIEPLSEEEDKESFIFQIKTDKPNQEFTLYYNNYANSFIDWDNDGINDFILDFNNYNHTQSHVYAEPGLQTIRIKGMKNKLFPYGSTDELKNMIIDIRQWGTNLWFSMDFMFEGCSNLQTISAKDNPNLSKCTSARGMFKDAISFNANIGNWETSNIKDMSEMFLNATNFNCDLNSWKVQNVETMEFMFSAAVKFNGDIKDWNVEKVKDFNYMFRAAFSFNQNISGWDLSASDYVKDMFNGCSALNQDLSTLIISRNHVDENMILGAYRMDENNLGKYLEKISSINPYINYINICFQDKRNKLKDIVDELKAKSIQIKLIPNEPFEIKIFKDQTYDLSKYIDYSAFFGYKQNPQLKITKSAKYGKIWFDKNENNKLDEDEIALQNQMFSLNEIDKLKYTSVSQDSENLEFVLLENDFEIANLVLNLNIQKLLTEDEDSDALIVEFDIPASSANKNIMFMARNINGAKLNACVDWNNNGVYEEYNMGIISHQFKDSGKHIVRIKGNLNSISFSQYGFSSLSDIRQWGSIEWLSMEEMFKDCPKLTTFSANDKPNLESCNDISSMFENCYNFNGDISDWDMSSVQYMRFAFLGARSFNNDISKWKVSNVKSMSGMFEDCNSFDIDISKWNFDSNNYFHNFLSNAKNFSPTNYKKLLKKLLDYSSSAKSITVSSYVLDQEAQSYKDELINASWQINDLGSCISNHTPILSSLEPVSMDIDKTYKLSISNIYSDEDNDELGGIKIETIPSKGDLWIKNYENYDSQIIEHFSIISDRFVIDPQYIDQIYYTAQKYGDDNISIAMSDGIQYSEAQNLNIYNEAIKISIETDEIISENDSERDIEFQLKKVNDIESEAELEFRIEGLDPSMYEFSNSSVLISNEFQLEKYTVKLNFDDIANVDKHIQIQIVANDKIKLESTTDIIIKEDDFKPIIANSPNFFHLGYDALNSSIIHQFTCSDMDQTENTNFIWELIGDEAFSVNMNTGELYLANKDVLVSGEYDLRICVNDGVNTSSYYDFKIEYDELSTGIEDLAKNYEVKIYKPIGLSEIHIISKEYEIDLVQIYSLDSRLLYSKPSKSKELTITNSLKKGVYIIKLLIENKEIVRKIYLD
ncbi:MAG: BspA family leucine-rich repeat surface protein [Marinifilaceae bacterium]|jgi:surface protein|nr:BspA family leucine-rich repeat surface protein [Marinifilaceae bacterium]